MTQPILTRESDGLRFEPTVQSGMVRCEACLELVEPSQVKEHRCTEWWNTVPTNQTEMDTYLFGPNKLLRGPGTKR